MNNDKQKLIPYLKLEHELIRLFRHFTGLCKACFDLSLEAVKNERNIDTHELCCCLVDNQIQDHWIFVDKAQRLMHGPSWNKCLAEKNSDWLGVGRKRLPGNGPCPALTSRGCALKSLRPPTCSTQLCPKMLRLLNNLGIVKGKTTSPRQIEEFANIPSPLNALFGINRQEVRRGDIEKFLKLIRELDYQCLAIPKARWREAINKEISNFKQILA